jgi:hypothetical protein
MVVTVKQPRNDAEDNLGELLRIRRLRGQLADRLEDAARVTDGNALGPSCR